MVKILEILEYLKEKDIKFEFFGDEGRDLQGFSSLRNYKEGTISWIKNEKYLPRDKVMDFACVITTKEECFKNIDNRIEAADPKRVFFLVVEGIFAKEDGYMEESQKFGTFISSKVKLGKNVKIGAGCVLDGDIMIGENTVIQHNVNIQHKVHIGKNCTVNCGATIGVDGFNYTTDEEGNHHLTKHHGGVFIGDSAYIGAGTMIERGVIDDTHIGEGSMIDAQSLISHNSVIGKNVTIVGGTTGYGSIIVEDEAYIATSMLRENITIGKGSYVGMGAVVLNDVEPGDVVAGLPAKSIKKK